MLSNYIRIDAAGGTELLQLAQEAIREPGPGEVRLRIRAIGLNRAEVIYRRGEYAIQPGPGSRIGVEAAGEIEALGAGVQGWQIGQRVAVLQTIDPRVHGVYAERSVVPAASLIATPAALSDREAAALWHAASMAWGPLVMLGRVGPEDVVLITAASSAVGLAAIQVAKAEGATVIATTRGAAKREALRAAGADHVIVTDEEQLVERVLAVTAGRGATLILDSVLGPQLAQLAEGAAPGARIVLGGLLASDRIELPVWPVLLKGLQLQGFVGFLAVQSDPLQRAAFERYVNTHLERLRPRIDREFPLAQAAAAQAAMEAGHQVGKILLVTG